MRCTETQEETDSATSYIDAASRLVQRHRYAESVVALNSNNAEKIQKIFSDCLIGKKKSQCDSIVEMQIIDRGLIAGTISVVKEIERFQEFKEYLTEKFIIKVVFGHGLFRGATEIQVTSRE